MKIVSVEDFELLGFFEIEPEMDDPNDSWSYNDSVYTVQQGDICLTFAIHPSYKDVRIIIKHKNNTIYEINTMGVNDVVLHEEKNKEMLEIIIDKKESVIVKIKPNI